MKETTTSLTDIEPNYHMNHAPSPVSFREDINGLRAWAVVAVLLFHFSLIGLPGGFAGVDVFFVISGYLMTAIIISGYEKGNFCIWTFYLLRARRILPALMVVIAVLLLLGWFLLQTEDYQFLGSQSAYALVFLSNIQYWRATGYFDVAAHEKWLLHTWSLAVEAQFYLLYPIIFITIRRFSKTLKALTIGLLLLFLASLALSLVMSKWKPVATFYLLPTRGWELVSGALVYLIARQIKLSTSLRNIAFCFGWILLIASFILIDESLSWPSYWAIFPVLGTSLIIISQQETCILTNNKLTQWLGDRSYSLYLWHWPLVVALYYSELKNDWAWVVTAIIVSLLLANYSYRFVEMPTRKLLTKDNLIKEIIVILIATSIIALAAISVRLFVFSERTPAAVEIAANEAKNFNPRREQCLNSSTELSTFTKCIYGKNDIAVFLMGDSHSISIASALSQLTQPLNKGVASWAMSGCPTIKGFRYNNDHTKDKRLVDICKTFNENGFNKISKEKVSVPIVLASRWSAYLKGLNEPGDAPFYYFNEKIADRNSPKLMKQYLDGIKNTACELQKERQVYLLRPIPEMGIDVPKILSRNIMFGQNRDEVKISLADYHKRNQLVWQAQDSAATQCGVKILNPLPYLCDTQYCYGSKNGRPLYYDDDHLSEYGNKFLIPMFEEIFKNFGSMN